jgi:hypothetical protein
VITLDESVTAMFAGFSLLTSLRFHFLRYLYVPTRCANPIHNKKVKKQCQQSTSL